MNKVEIRAHLYILLATILVAGSFLATEKLAGVINPFSLILLRFLAAFLLLAPFILFRRRYRSKILSTMPRAMIISFFYAAYFVLMFVSLEETTALNTGTLYTLVPLVTAILCIFIFKDKITLTQWIVYLIGIIGTCGVIFNANLELFLSFKLNHGDLVYLFSILLMAGYSISMKLLYKNDTPVVLVFCTLIGGAIWMFLILIIMKEPLNWQLLDVELGFYMAYLVVMTTLVTLYLYQKGTIALGPKSVMSYIYLNPAVVAIFVYFIDGTKISLEVLGFILITMASTAILQISINNRKKL